MSYLSEFNRKGDKMTKLDFETLMDWLKEKYPYSMRRWITQNYWIEDEEYQSSDTTTNEVEK